MQKHVLRFPECLRFNEVDSVLRFVALALSRIEFELHRFFVSPSTWKRRLLLQRILPRREATSQLEEWSLDGEKKQSSCGVNAEFDAEERGRGCESDVVICAELFDPVNNKFLNQVSAVGNARYERGAGNCNSTERQPRTDRANKKRGHAEGDQWELPDARSDGEVFGFAEIQCVND